MIAVVALIAVAVLTARERRRRRTSAPDRWWPWLIGVIEEHAARGRDDLPTVTVGVCLQGPPQLRRVARSAVRAHPGGEPLWLLAALRDDVATARGDRLVGTVAAIHTRTARADGPLARLRAVEAAVSADERACAAVVSAGSTARWLLLAPLVPVAGGLLTGPPAWLAAAVAVGAWWSAARWLRWQPRVRVFAAAPIGRPR